MSGDLQSEYALSVALGRPNASALFGSAALTELPSMFGPGNLTEFPGPNAIEKIRKSITVSLYRIGTFCILPVGIAL